MIFTQTEFAKKMGVTRQAISKAISEGAIQSSANGKIDTENKTVIIWANSTALKRVAWLKLTDNPKSQKPKKSLTRQKQTKLEPVEEVTGQDDDQKVQVHVPNSALSPSEVAEKIQLTKLTYEQQRVIKIMNENSLFRDGVIYRDKFKDIEELSLNFLVTTMKQVGNVLVMDLSKSILANNGVINSDFFQTEEKLIDVIEQYISYKKKLIKKSIEK